MDFPADLIPSQRTFDPGNWPIGSYNAIDGAEVRILYGSRRTNMKLSLTYQNLSDADAARFLEHYADRQGTFLTFKLPPAAGTRKGWAADESYLSAAASGNAWRYEGPPSLANIRPGRSSVTLTLLGVM